ncbi:DUF6207 family protein [Streptomyces sp. NPDC058735]|uniref:DUF6207 family protein n=1 Tax=unclassified Streptomyces TaxID=2593676 RepID=UPI00369FC34E
MAGADMAEQGLVVMEDAAADDQTAVAVQELLAVRRVVVPSAGTPGRREGRCPLSGISPRARQISQPLDEA